MTPKQARHFAKKRAAEGITYQAIADELKEKGFVNRRGTAPTVATITSWMAKARSKSATTSAAKSKPHQESGLLVAIKRVLETEALSHEDRIQTALYMLESVK